MEFTGPDLMELRKSEYLGTVADPGRRPMDRFNRKEFDRGVALAELFHENTKLNVPGDRAPHHDMSIGDFSALDYVGYVESCLPPEFEHHEEIELPAPNPLDVSIGDVLERRRSVRSYAGEGVSLETIGDLLHYGCGVSRREEMYTVDLESGGSETIYNEFRTYPSAGSLYPVEPYVFVHRSTSDIDPGLYHYSPSSHSLRKLRETDDATRREFTNMWIDSTSGTNDYGDAALTIVLSGVLWRMLAKYGARGYRLLLENAGHLCQNLHLVATALDLGSIPVASHEEGPIDDFLGVNGVDESVVHSIFVGVPTEGVSHE